jgi:hypothetical protein
MLVVFVTVAAVLAIGTSLYFTNKFKQERDTLKVKFKQSQEYADNTAKINNALTTANRTLVAEIVAVKDVVGEQSTMLAQYKNRTHTPPQADKSVSITAAPTMKAKKTRRSRSNKKAIA